MKTTIELAQHIRSLDLLKVPMNELQAWLQAFGQSAKGQREELIERLHRVVWRDEFNQD
jgi:hypothetical protein